MPADKPMLYKDIYPLCRRYAQGQLGSETLAVVMTSEFIDAIQSLGKKRIAGVFGRHDDGTLTISLLALEDDQDVVAAAHVNGDEPGQQVWPQISILSFEKLLLPPK